VPGDVAKVHVPSRCVRGWVRGKDVAALVIEEDARLADVVRSSHDAIVGETLDGRVTVWNRAAEDLYGYRAQEMIGHCADRLYPPDRRTDEAATLRQVAGGQRLGRYVTERTHRDGTTITVSVRASPIVDGTGTTVGVASVCCEVGAELADVLAGVGHELRTSLNAIIGFTGTLLMRLPGPLNDEQEHQLQLVQTSAEQLLSRINQLSRPGGR
jgi:PAS domain S-box-containing protein